MSVGPAFSLGQPVQIGPIDTPINATIVGMLTSVVPYTYDVSWWCGCERKTAYMIEAEIRAFGR